ncbi:hypothetical protein D3C84_435400 [compost metagenome]
MSITATVGHQPWNKGKLVGQKAPFRLRDIWAIRVRLQLAEKTRDLALRLGNRQQAACLRPNQAANTGHSPW